MKKRIKEGKRKKEREKEKKRKKETNNPLWER
jgi:hypothetical protein